MTRYLVDTSAYSAYMRGHEELRDSFQIAETLVLNSVVLGELLAGFKDGNRYDDNLSWLDKFRASPRVQFLGVDRDTADRYSEIQVYLKRRGTPIPTNDVWIAASAMQHGLCVLTTDPHFEKVAQVVIECYLP